MQIARLPCLILLAASFCNAFAQPLEPQPRNPIADATLALKKQGQSLLDPPPTVMLWVDDGKVYRWTIHLGGVTHLDAIIQAVGGAADNPCSAMDRWCEGAAGMIVEMTRDVVRSRNLDPDFNVNTDVHIHFFMRNFPADAPCARHSKPINFDTTPGAREQSSYSSSYRGLNRLPRRNDQGEVIEVPAPVSSGDQISVEITPDRSVWKLRETITGKIFITNTGNQRVPLDAWWIDSVDVVDVRGANPPSFHVMGNIEPDMNAPRNVYLSPGERHEGQFKIYTDRSRTMVNGYYLDPGPWQLTYTQGKDDGIDVVVNPVDVEVKVGEGEYAGPRIRGARGAGPSLLIAREHNVMEVVDTTDGHRIIPSVVAPFAKGSLWTDLASIAISDDGKLAAYTKWRETRVNFQALAAGVAVPPDVTCPVSFKIGAGGFRPARFAPDGRSLFCKSNYTWIQIDLASGKALRTFTLPEQWTELSPDGRFAATIKGSTKASIMRSTGRRGDDTADLLIMGTQEGGSTVTVPIKERGMLPNIEMGHGGVYVIDEFNSSALYVPYDGSPTRTLDVGGQADFVGESADGMTCAFLWPGGQAVRTNENTTIVVFNVADGARLCTIGGDHPLSAVMIETPLRIVSFPKKAVEGDSWGGMTWLEEEAVVHDARTGKHVGKINTTPPPGSLPPAEEMAKQP